MSRVPGRIKAGDDTGATLIFALVLITVVAMVVGGLLSFADTSVRVTVAVRSQAADAYAADGAAQVAINQLRTNSYVNDVNSPSFPKCFGNGASSDTLSLPNFYPGPNGTAASSAAVTCAPDPATGAAGGLVPITATNKPGNAILTLSTNPAEDGLNIKALNSGTPFLVHGSVVSDSNIRVSNGSLKSNVGVFAHTGCTGTITSTPAAACTAGTAADPNLASEAALGTPANAVPVYQRVPANISANCPGKVMRFQPGYYDDAAGLSALMNGVGANPCKGSVWWFQPGTYYFDFHNTSNPLLSGTDQWLIKDGQLIAGTPTNPAGAVIAAPTSPAAIPGACKNPITSTAAVGVQFIFGGDSQLQLAGSAGAEICGSYHAGRPPIALYGQKTGDETPVASATSKPSSVPNADAVFGATASVANLANVDGLAASWVKGNSSSQTGTFTVGGFAPAGTIPPGSVLDSATLRVVYQNTAGAVQDSRTVQLTPAAGGGPISITLPASSGGGTQTALVDLFGSGTSALAAAVHAFGFSSANIGYSATLKHAGIERVDAIQLDLGYTAPAFRAEDTSAIAGNCLASSYTGGSAGQCAVLSTTTSYSGAFYIQGTSYLPKAVIDLTLSSVSAQVLRFGVIARALWVKETGSITFTGAVIEIPDNSLGLGPGGTVVYLNVYLCPGAASCSSGSGSPRLRARVEVFDPTGSANPPARQITIQSWALQR